MNWFKDTKHLVYAAFSVALLAVSNYIFSFIPHVEVTTFLFIVLTFYLGKDMIMVAEVFALIHIAQYGIHYWSIFYLYIWLIPVLITLLLKDKTKSMIVYAIVAGIFGCLYGTFTVLVTFPLGWRTTLAWWLSGLLWDVTHGICNFAVMLVLYKPINSALEIIFKEAELE